MKLKFLLFLFLKCIFLNNLHAQILSIDLSDINFVFNEKTLQSGDKSCRVFNCLSKEYLYYGDLSLKPLILFKVFDYKGVENQIVKPARAIDLKDYLKNTVLPKLAADMMLNVASLELTNSDLNIHVIDTLLIYDGKSFRLVKGGVLISEFFNIYPYKQLNPLQTNQSVFNVESTSVEIDSWTRDSIPIPNIEALIGGKIFLLCKNKDNYTFFRHPFDCSDCPLSFYNEYVYRKDYGVVAFRSKHLQLNPDTEFRDLFGKIIESDKYYYFK